MAERSLLCLGKKLQSEIKHKFYVQHALTAFGITKEEGANAERCLAIRNCRNLVSFVLIQNMNSQHFGNVEHDSSRLKQ